MYSVEEAQASITSIKNKDNLVDTYIASIKKNDEIVDKVEEPSATSVSNRPN